jgi:hypothetical protein
MLDITRPLFTVTEGHAGFPGTALRHHAWRFSALAVDTTLMTDKPFKLLKKVAIVSPCNQISGA